ncbi:hypothetical protein QOT17_005992 [Balamuthia mandrillaris]
MSWLAHLTGKKGEGGGNSSSPPPPPYSTSPPSSSTSSSSSLYPSFGLPTTSDYSAIKKKRHEGSRHHGDTFEPSSPPSSTSSTALQFVWIESDSDKREKKKQRAPAFTSNSSKAVPPSYASTPLSYSPFHATASSSSRVTGSRRTFSPTYACLAFAQCQLDPSLVPDFSRVGNPLEVKGLDAGQVLSQAEALREDMGYDVAFEKDFLVSLKQDKDKEAEEQLRKEEAHRHFLKRLEKEEKEREAAALNEWLSEQQRRAQQQKPPQQNKVNNNTSQQSYSDNTNNNNSRLATSDTQQQLVDLDFPSPASSFSSSSSSSSSSSVSYTLPRPAHLFFGDNKASNTQDEAPPPYPGVSPQRPSAVETPPRQRQQQQQPPPVYFPSPTIPSSSSPVSIPFSTPSAISPVSPFSPFPPPSNFAAAVPFPSMPTTPSSSSSSSQQHTPVSPVVSPPTFHFQQQDNGSGYPGAAVATTNGRYHLSPYTSYSSLPPPYFQHHSNDSSPHHHSHLHHFSPPPAQQQQVHPHPYTQIPTTRQRSSSSPSINDTSTLLSSPVPVTSSSPPARHFTDPTRKQLYQTLVEKHQLNAVIVEKALEVYPENDQRKITAFVQNYQRLLDVGFNEAHIKQALLLHENDKGLKKTTAYLKQLDKLVKRGFKEKHIFDALSLFDNDAKKATEFLEAYEVQLCCFPLPLFCFVALILSPSYSHWYSWVLKR